MSSIDNRIVNMVFNNKGFEAGVASTLDSLKKLNESLKMKNAGKGLEEVGKGITKLSSSGLGSLGGSVEGITSKFSAMGIIAASALNNITNKAINAGAALVKSLTIDPVKAGLSEYETKMGSIQTILTNTSHNGTTLDQVNTALGELNTYADKTIYNFAQMTDNIGKFTAAGIDLDTSVASIKGIANLAAASGSTATQASSAMYQLSQALAAGKVSLMDWNSVINAGMGGKLFQDALIRTSEKLGTGAESMIEKFGSFRESLTKGEWLTTEVLTETLKQISGAYTEADLIAQGYTESQAKAIVELAKNATAAATEVKTITQLFDTMKESVQSGWAQSWEYIIGDSEQSKKLLTGIKDAFDNLIGPSTKARNKMLKFWNKAGGRDDVIKGFTNIFQSLGKGFKSIGDAWKEVFPSLTGKTLIDLSEKFKNFTEKIKMSDETAGKIKNTFKGVFSVFKTAGSAIGGVVKAFSPLLGIFKPIGSAVLSVTSALGQFVTKISDAVSKSQIFTKITDGIKSGFESIGKFLGSAGDGISNFFGNLDFSNVSSLFSKAFSGIGGGIGKALGTINFETLTNLAKSLVGLGIFKSLKNIFDEFKGVGEGLSGVFESFKGIGENVKGVLDSTREALTSWQNSLSAGTLIKLAAAIGILAASLLVLSSIEPGKLATALAGMAGLFAELTLTMAAITKIGSFKGLVKTSTGLLAISSAILILSFAMKNLANLKINEVVTGLASMAGLLVMMAASVKMFSKSSSGLIKTSTGLIIFGAAMHVMASALQKLGEIDAETLGSGLFALAGVLVELAAFLAAAKFGKLGVTDSVGILVLSAALNVLAHAVKSFGSLNPDEIIRGLAGIAGILAEIAIFSKLSGSGVGMIATAVGLTTMSAAMLVMSAAMKSLGSMQWETIAKGLVNMAGALTIIGVAGTFISGAQLTLAAVGVAAMGAALLVLNSALNSMGGMSWEEIGKSMVALAGSLTILAVAMYAMTGCLVGAAAMVVMSAALALFVPQMIALSQLSLSQIGISLLALAGAFAVIGVAGLLLTPVVPTLALLGAAIGLIGVGCLAAGVGISAFGTGLAVVAATLSASGVVILEFVKQLINLLPQLGLKAGEAMVNFAGAIANGGSQIVAAFTTLISSILTAVGTLVPKIAQVGVDIVLAFAKGLAQGVPQLVTYGIQMVVGVLEGIASNIGQVINAGADLIVNFLNGVANNLGRVIEAGINLALSFIEGVANGISSNSGRLEAAIRSVIQAMTQAGLAVIRGAISGFTSGGKQLLQGFCNGVKSMMSSAGSAVKSVINAAKNAASNLGGALVSAGRSLIEGLITGIRNKAASVANAARDVVTKAINAAKSALQINSPSKVFIGIGGSVNEGFAKGLTKYANESVNAATALSNSVIDAASIRNITPVVDLSNARSQLASLSGMQINGVTGTLARSIGQIQNRTNNNDVISALKDLQNTMNTATGNVYNVNGITYDDGSNVSMAVQSLIRAAKIERRV